jgi:hypothetical protein
VRMVCQHHLCQHFTTGNAQHTCQALPHQTFY